MRASALVRVTQREAPEGFRSDAESPGPLALLREGLADIASRRPLIRYLVEADMKKRGADTALGNLWWVLDPLLQMVVYVVFVTILTRGRSIPDYPLFIFAAILPWKWFNTAVIDATRSLIDADRLIKRVQFPKIVLPLAATTAGVTGFAFGLIPLAVIMLFYPDRISPLIAFIPLIALVQFVFTVGVALLVAAGNVFFRDLGNVAGHVLRLWWFLSPGLYSLAVLDESGVVAHHPFLRTLAGANPFAILLEAYRSVIYGSTSGPPHVPDLASLALLMVASLVFVAGSIIAFKRLEPTFAKVL
ncbi:MAG TPA: ABC transporter permease [Candidatus Limnocylindrales bacterium]|nr:ABC transporter permease [Candidatus Limnocylindrales bacterium]